MRWWRGKGSGEKTEDGQHWALLGALEMDEPSRDSEDLVTLLFHVYSPQSWESLGFQPEVTMLISAMVEKDQR